MKIKCAVFCTNANGEPDIHFCEVECTTVEYTGGDHYKVAKADAISHDYEGPMLACDENDDAWRHLNHGN